MQLLNDAGHLMLGGIPYAIGYERPDSPQMWTGQFTVVPINMKEVHEQDAEPQMLMCPVWTSIPRLALIFTSEGAAQKALESHDQSFHWGKSVCVLNLTRLLKLKLGRA